MLRFRAALAAAAVCAPLALAQQPPAQAPPPAAKAAEPVRPVLVKGLQDALKAEENAFVRMLMAKALLKVAPDDEAAAKALVKELVEGELKADAYQTIQELIPAAPPALIRALVPVLKDKDQTNRQRAAALLGAIDPKNLP